MTVLDRIVPIEPRTWPRFREVPEPRMVALYTANGSGTKLFQGFLDGHPQIYMVPAYPLMYLYPHWNEWRETLRPWSWISVIDAFCVKHASVIDTRRIPGFDGLSALGDNQDGFIAIDETRFRAFLSNLLEGEKISARTFLLAVHYAYAFCRNEDLAMKRILVYHIHVPEYVSSYLMPDFPDMLVLGTVRDPRSNFRGRYDSSEVGVDLAKMNKTDALIYRRRVYYFITRYFYEGLDILGGFSPDRVRMVRHEDLFYRPRDALAASAAFLGLDYHPCLEKITFGGREWWGDMIYDMEPMNAVNPRVVSQDWKTRIDLLDWYVFDGLFWRYMNKYGYRPEKYQDGSVARIILFMAQLLPTKTERDVFKMYVLPSFVKNFWRACLDEAAGRVRLKDYTFNAYYRHKWTQRDLRLHRPRWWVETLARTLAGSNGKTGVALWQLRFVQGIYIGITCLRFLGALLFYPAMIVKRWGVTTKAWLRMVGDRNFLPETLPGGVPILPQGQP